MKMLLLPIGIGFCAVGLGVSCLVSDISARSQYEEVFQDSWQYARGGRYIGIGNIILGVTLILCSLLWGFGIYSLTEQDLFWFLLAGGTAGALFCMAGFLNGNAPMIRLHLWRRRRASQKVCDPDENPHASAVNSQTSPYHDDYLSP